MSDTKIKRVAEVHYWSGLLTVAPGLTALDCEDIAAIDRSEQAGGPF